MTRKSKINEISVQTKPGEFEGDENRLGNIWTIS